MILAPDPDQQRLERIEFIPLRDGKLIAVLVTTDGRIENRLLLEDRWHRLERIHNYLNQLLSGMTIDEVRDRVIREIAEDKNKYDEAVATALRLGHAVFVSQPERSASVVVAGQANLIDDVQPDRMRDLLRTLEDKETLVRLLDRTRHAEGLQVFLGAETAAAFGQLGRRDVLRSRGDADRRARGDRTDANELRQGDVGCRLHCRHGQPAPRGPGPWRQLVGSHVPPR